MKIMKSKVVALVVTLAMVLSIIASPIASAATTVDAADFLAEIGVLEGDNGDLMLDKELTRQDAVVLMSRLLGVETEAEVYSTEGMTFGDIVDDYYAPYIAWAQANGIVEGYSEEVFGYGDFLTAWQTKALMVRALGHTDEPDENIEFMADALGITTGLDAEDDLAISRANMAVLAYNTVHTETISGTVLGEQIGVLEPAEAPVLTDVKASAETTAAETVTITGTVEPVEAEVTVGETVAEVAEDGTFSVEVELEEGENVFDVFAKNGYKTATEEVLVTRVAGYEMEAEVATEDTVKVTFSAAVPDTSAVEFDLKGTVSINIDVEWNEDATVATLVAPGALLEGAYTLTVDGLDFVNDENTANLVVIENGVATIEVASENLVIEEAWDGTDTIAVVYYKLLDRYGVDITEDVVSKSDLDVATSKSKTGYTIDNEKGKLTITYSVELEAKDIVSVTLIASETGAALSKTLTVVDEAQINEIKINGIEFDDEDDTKLLVGDKNEGDVYILVDAFDQYGNDVTDKDAFDTADGSATAEVLYVVSDSNVTLEEKDYEDDDENEKVKLLVTNTLTSGKEVTIHIVSKLSGNRESITLDFKDASAPAEVKIGAQEQVVAANDVEEGLVIPIYVYDQDGVELTADEIIDAYDDGEIKVSGSGILDASNSVYSDANNDPDLPYYNATDMLWIADSGDNKGKIVNKYALKGTDESTSVITVSVVTASESDVDTYTIDIEEPYYEKEIEVDEEPAENLLMDAVTKMNVKFTDQYGREIETEDVLADTLVTIENSDTDILSVTATPSVFVLNNKDADLLYTDAQKVAKEDGISITTVGTEEGSAKITVKLYKLEENGAKDDFADYNVVDKLEVSFDVTKGVPGELTFEIEDIPTLVYEKAVDKVNGIGAVLGAELDGTNPYERPIKVIAKDDSGKTYAIPSDRILSVAVEGKYLVATQAVVDATNKIEKQDGERLVAPATAIAEFDLADATEDDTITTNMSVAISTDEGVKNVVKEVTISNKAPKALKVVFTDTSIDTTKNPYELAEDAKLVEEVTGAHSTVTSEAVYTYVLDQYGVYTQANITVPGTTALADVSYLVSNKDRFNGALAYDGTNFTFAKEQILEDEDVYVMFQSLNSGVYATLKLKVTDSNVSTLDTAKPTAAVTYSIAHAVKATDPLTITATFNEAMADAPVVQIAITGENTVAATDMTRVSATEYTYSHVVGAGDGTATVALSVGTDLAGNVITAAPTSGATFTVDNTAPVATITSADYTAGTDTLVITGTGFEGTFDATKVTYKDDLANSKVLTGGTVTIDSATQITIVLVGADATAIEALANYGGADDVIDVAVDFLTDVAGNVGGTAKVDAAVTIN